MHDRLLRVGELLARRREHRATFEPLEFPRHLVHAGRRRGAR